MKYIKYLLLSLSLLLFVFNLNIVSSTVIYVTNFFFKNIFSLVFPFIILSNILIYFDYHIFLSSVFGKLFSKLFKVSKNSSQIIILSMLSSHPNNAVYIKDMLDKKLISKMDANKLIMFTSFPSISYVVGFVGTNLYNSVWIGILLMFYNYLCNFMIGFSIRNKDTLIIDESITKNNEELFSIIKNSIFKAISVLLIIYGYLCIFNIFINIFIHYFDINLLFIGIINGILEMSSGISFIYNLEISYSLKLFLTSFFLNFSGLSIIFQIKSIYNFDIKKILIYKLIFSVISSLFFVCTC